MPEAKANKLFKTFTKGLITEASFLNFPEDSSYDESNFVLNRDGTRFRRLGVDAEALHEEIRDGSAINEENLRDGYITQYEWLAAGGDGNYNFWVVQVYSSLYFFSLNGTSISSEWHEYEVDLDDYKVGTDSPGLYRCGFTSGKGRLFVVNKAMEPLYIEYDSATDTFTEKSYEVKVRDTIGLETGLAVNERPTTLTPEHNYNLFNQGWYPGAVKAYSSTPDVLTQFFNTLDAYPSNADIIYFGKISSANNADIIGLWGATQQEKFELGTTPAAKGHYILNAFYKDYSAASGVSGISPVIEEWRPTTVAFYSGRVWLAGVESKEQNGTIFFSQVIQSTLNIGQCYQDADPTNEQISDLVATDGGTITIPEIGTVYKLEAVDSFIIVFASNGIWTIGGIDGFRADDFSVRKISNVGALSPTSIVVAEGAPLFWSTGGIYAIRPNQVSSELRAENITDQTIQTFYNKQIPAASKYHINSVYDIGEKKVYWFYNTDVNYDGNSFVNKYDGVLILDIVLGAFFKYKISSLDSYSPYIAAAGVTSTRRRTSIINPVLANVGFTSYNVVNSDLDNVITTTFRTGSSSSTLKMIAVLPGPEEVPSGDKEVPFVPGPGWRLSVVEFSNDAFVDWQTWDENGADYTSYIETGFDIGEDIARSKQIAYINVAMNRTEDTWEAVDDNTVDLNKQSSCTLQVKWDWHTSSNGNRWSSPVQVYRHVRAYMPSGANTSFDPGGGLVVTKNRVRGHGRAIQLRFASESGKDLQLVGWQLAYRGRTND